MPPSGGHGSPGAGRATEHLGGKSQKVDIRGPPSPRPLCIPLDKRAVKIKAGNQSVSDTSASRVCALQQVVNVSGPQFLVCKMRATQQTGRTVVGPPSPCLRS